jgi:UDP-N-acetylmuramate dehydrogenase
MNWFRDNAQGFEGTLHWDEPISKHSYYKIGGPARLMAMPRSLADLQWLAQGLQAEPSRLFILGSGSNLLAADRGFDGLVVKTGRLNLQMEGIASGRIRTGSSVAISSLLRKAAQEGWAWLRRRSGGHERGDAPR